FNINDLMEEIRLQGFFNISDIEYAILETSGQLSIIPKTNLTPPTKEDLNIQSTQDSLPIPLILDGKVDHENLALIKKDLKWLRTRLNKSESDDFSDIFIAILDSHKNFYFQKK
ncbi:DUF421 domain-containing protein, partial [Coprococcus sp. MSK.21.13]|nr:DUF421 domain-containing protein [Bacteroidales bacterium MSK.15.36]NSJ92851.1 DUF421 domain-containing protein [Coprococcus sp. MSK.21.13]